MKTRTSTIARRSGRKTFPESYRELMALHPLRPIHDSVELANATEVIDRMAGHNLNRDQADYLDALSTLAAAYEDDHDPLEIPKMSGLDALRTLLAGQGLTGADLARILGVHRSMGSKILQGERALTVAHLKVIRDRFKVDIGLFLAE